MRTPNLSCKLDSRSDRIEMKKVARVPRCPNLVKGPALSLAMIAWLDSERKLRVKFCNEEFEVR